MQTRSQAPPQQQMPGGQQQQLPITAQTLSDEGLVVGNPVYNRGNNYIAFKPFGWNFKAQGFGSDFPQVNNITYPGLPTAKFLEYAKASLDKKRPLKAMNAYSELVREAIAIRDNKKRIAKTFGRRAKKKENVKVDGDDEMEEEKGPLSAEELKAEEEAKAKFDKAQEDYLTNWFQGASQRMKQDQIESLKQSQLNLNSIIKAVNVQKLTPENAVRDVMTAQVKSNIANGRHSRYGLDGLNDWVITTQVGKAEDKVKHFQEFAAAITSFDPVQSLASSGDAAIKTAVQSVSANPFLPPIIPMTSEEIEAKFPGMTYTQRTKAMKAEYAEQVKNFLAAAQAAEMEAYNYGYIVGSKLAAVVEQINRFAVPYWEKKIGDMKQMASVLKFANYEGNVWRSGKKTCKGVWPMQDISPFIQQDGSDNFRMASTYLKRLIETGQTALSASNVDDGMLRAKDNPGAKIANFGTELFGVLLNRIYYNDISSTQFTDRMGYTFEKLLNMPAVEVLDPVTAARKYQISIGLATPLSMALQSRSWYTKFQIMTQRGYNVASLQLGTSIRNNCFDCLYVLVFKRMSNIEDTPIYAIQFSGSVTLKNIQCDPDDQIVLVGINYNSRNEIPPYPRTAGFSEQLYSLGKLGGSEGNDFLMKEDIFAYGPNFMRSGWVDYSCKFSGLFEIAEEGELSNYDPNVKKPRMNIKDYTMKNTASVVGSLRTYDSAVTLYDDGQIAPIYDDQFEFGLNQPEILTAQPYNELKLLQRSVDSDSSTLENKVYRLANLFKAILQLPRIDPEFARSVSDFLAAKGISDISSHPQSQKIRDILVKNGVNLLEVNDIAPKIGMTNFLDSLGNPVRTAQLRRENPDKGKFTQTYQKYRTGYKRRYGY